MTPPSGRVMPGVISHEITPGGLGADCWEPGPPLLCPVPGGTHGEKVLLLRDRVSVRAALAWETIRNLAAVVAGYALAGVTMQHPSGLLRLASPRVAVRAALNQVWRRSAMEALRPGVRAEAERLVTGLAAAGDVAPLVNGLARPMELFLVSLVTGCDEAMALEVTRLSDATTGALIRSPADHPPVAEAWQRWYSLTPAILAAAPGDCLISRTAAVLRSWPGMGEEDVIAAVATVINGVPTIFPALVRSLAWLLEQPDVMAACRKDPALIPATVNRALVLAAHFNFGLPGACPAGAVLVDHAPALEIPPGTVVCPIIHAAHADRLEEGEEPDGRTAWLAWGAGVHRCLGEHLGRERTTMSDRIINGDDTEIVAVEDGDEPQSLWFRVGPVFHGGVEAKDPGVWISYQPHYLHSDMTGPVLLTPETWRRLASIIETRIAARTGTGMLGAPGRMALLGEMIADAVEYREVPDRCDEGCLAGCCSACAELADGTLCAEHEEDQRRAASYLQLAADLGITIT